MLSTQIRIIFDVLSIVGGVLLHCCPTGTIFAGIGDIGQNESFPRDSSWMSPVGGTHSFSWIYAGIGRTCLGCVYISLCINILCPLDDKPVLAIVVCSYLYSV